jgi:hypothetical protein
MNNLPIGIIIGMAGMFILTRLFPSIKHIYKNHIGKIKDSEGTVDFSPEKEKKKRKGFFRKLVPRKNK